MHVWKRSATGAAVAAGLFVAAVVGLDWSDDDLDAVPRSETGDPPSEVPLSWTPALPFATSTTADSGVSRATGTGLDCDDDTRIEETHYFLEGPFENHALNPTDDVDTAPAAFAGDLTANIGLSGPSTSPSSPIAPHRLEPAISHATLGNERGTLQLRLDGGECGAPDLTPTGEPLTVGGSGPLTVVGGTGAFREATLDAGQWDLEAEVAPGADNRWSLALGGALAVLAPGLEVSVADATWGNLGLDYVVRRVTVIYRIENVGPGDAYGVSLDAIETGTGVHVRDGAHQDLGDLLAGESTRARVTYQLGLLAPCDLVILGCSFTTTLDVTMPDALDVPHDMSDTVGATAPNLPPPLED